MFKHADLPVMVPSSSSSSPLRPASRTSLPEAHGGDTNRRIAGGIVVRGAGAGVEMQVYVSRSSAVPAVPPLLLDVTHCNYAVANRTEAYVCLRDRRYQIHRRVFVLVLCLCDGVLQKGSGYTALLSLGGPKVVYIYIERERDTLPGTMDSSLRNQRVWLEW